MHKTGYLVVILALHLGWAALLTGHHGNREFLTKNGTDILLSTFALSLTYFLCRICSNPPNNRGEAIFLITLFSALAANFIYLLYSISSPHENSQYLITSTLLFLGIILLNAFLNSQKHIYTKACNEVLSGILMFALAILIGINLSPYILSPPPSYKLILEDETQLKQRSKQIFTDFYHVHLTEYQLPLRSEHLKLPKKITDLLNQTEAFRTKNINRGHISALDDKNFLVMELHGNIYHLTLKRDATSGMEHAHIKKLPAALPMNFEKLISSGQIERIVPSSFRVTDIHIDSENQKRILYAGHHFYHAGRKCITLRVSKLVGDVSLLLHGDVSPEWRVLYETIPCLPLAPPEAPSQFAGHQAGGRIIGLDEKTLLFSIGDHGYDGVSRPQIFSQDRNTSYGKIAKINRHTGKASLFSYGHRNPQGLYRAPDNSIWSTEHGPSSGDELNEINIGSNYGWPYALYGTNYGNKVWPIGIKQNSHDGYHQPAFTWTPAVAVSNLIGVEKSLFPLWKNNLLVGTFKEQALLRLQLHKNRVIYSEKIGIGRHRIRDLTETPNGEIFIWTDHGSLLRLRPRSSVPKRGESLAETGERLFLKCAGCHDVGSDILHGEGPSLYNIYQASIARHREYGYSSALLAKSAHSWSSKNLDLFLKDPRTFAPGTTMLMKVPDDYERRALIRHLKDK